MIIEKRKSINWNEKGKRNKYGSICMYPDRSINKENVYIELVKGKNSLSIEEDLDFVKIRTENI